MLCNHQFSCTFAANTTVGRFIESTLESDSDISEESRKALTTLKGHWYQATEDERAALNEIWTRAVTRMKVKVDKDVEFMQQLGTSDDTCLPMTNRSAVSHLALNITDSVGTFIRLLERAR